MAEETITIIGLGKIGCSIGLALAKSDNSYKLIGHDIDTAVAKKAVSIDAVKSVSWNLLRACDGANAVILAIPLDQVRDHERSQPAPEREIARPPELDIEGGLLAAGPREAAAVRPLDQPAPTKAEMLCGRRLFENASSGTLAGGVCEDLLDHDEPPEFEHRKDHHEQQRRDDGELDDGRPAAVGPAAGEQSGCAARRKAIRSRLSGEGDVPHAHGGTPACLR